MTPHIKPFFLANKGVTSTETLVVLDKWSSAPLETIALAGRSQMETALAAAVSSLEACARLPRHARAAILRLCSEELLRKREEFIHWLQTEAGKVWKDADGEVLRASETFRFAAELCSRSDGETLPLDASSRGVGYTGFSKRVPIGVCAFITPFNFPLNLVAHKIAPAIAAGCPFLLKPASTTPLCALGLGEILSQSALPPGSFSILPSSHENSALLIEDPRIRFLSFTGSAEVGWALKNRAGKKKVALELGGNAACIVTPETDLEKAVERITIGAFSQAGQSCISVQRILVQETIYDAFKQSFLAQIGMLRFGPVNDPQGDIGPLIGSKDCNRVENWIQEALALGAKTVLAGTRADNRLSPWVLEAVPHHSRLWNEEVFGPVAVLERYGHFEEAIKLANESRFGLQVGLFTNQISEAFAAWNRLDVGGVIVNDVPTWRVDQMPYGGVKDSGLGREGVQYAYEEMTEIRLLAIRS